MTSLSEVAEQAGVSTSTASRALNRPALVGPETAARVRAAAERLGYVPNPFARSLRVRGGKTLGLIVPDSTNPFFAEVAKGVEAACFRAGYSLVLCNSDRSLEKEQAQARVLHERRVDGVLLFNVGQQSAATIAWLLERSLPVVLVERRSPGPAVDCVVSDNAGGVRSAMTHLADLGHRRVACLIGEPAVSHHAERLAAYAAAVRRLGLVEDPELVCTGLTGYADGSWAAADLLRRADPPSALFCATDTVAIGAIHGAASVGRRVPVDVAVVGYGDTAPAAYVQPPLTSVAQEKLTVGARAVRVLLRRLAQRADGARWRPRTQVVPTRLVVRESSLPSPTPAAAAEDGRGRRAGRAVVA